jgi:hypothetical protein
LLGRRLQVLVESRDESPMGTWSLGTSCRYAPVRIPPPRGPQGRLVEVQATRLEEDGLVATRR